jgi:hypothetical protein
LIYNFTGFIMYKYFVNCAERAVTLVYKNLAY